MQRQSAGQLCFRERSSHQMCSPGKCGYSEQDVRYHLKSCYFQTLCTAFYPAIPAHQLLHGMNTLQFWFFLWCNSTPDKSSSTASMR